MKLPFYRKRAASAGGERRNGACPVCICLIGQNIIGNAPYYRELWKMIINGFVEVILCMIESVLQAITNLIAPYRAL